MRLCVRERSYLPAKEEFKNLGFFSVVLLVCMLCMFVYDTVAKVTVVFSIKYMQVTKVLQLYPVI